MGSLGKRVPAANPAPSEPGAVGPADTRDGEEKWRIKMELKELENEVLKLSIEDRGALAKKLILSVDAPSETENLRLWVAEAERRLKELREGTVEEIPVEEVFRRARAAIS